MTILFVLVSLVISGLWLFKTIRNSSEWFEPLLSVVAALGSIITYWIQSDDNSAQLEKFQQQLNLKTHQINDKEDSILSLTDTLLKAQHHLARYENSPANTDNTITGDNNNVVAANNSTVNINNGDKKPDIVKSFSVAGLIRTGIAIVPSDKVVISAGGSLSAGPNAGPTSPDGIRVPGFNAFLSPFQIDSRYAHASLMYKLSENSPWSFCGHGCEITGQEGQLIFEINDKRQIDNSGYYEVIVKVYCEKSIAAKPASP